MRGGRETGDRGWGGEGRGGEAGVWEGGNQISFLLPIMFGLNFSRAE